MNNSKSKQQNPYTPFYMALAGGTSHGTGFGIHARGIEEAARGIEEAAHTSSVISPAG